MVSHLTQKFAEQALDRPIESILIVLTFVGTLVLAFGVYLIRDELFK